ncbi:MAG TPA: glycosyltransferase family 1 protein [Candidatus Hydrogenedentes bacterium]|nr:glycosyltransferase family 1 protein [Candidatus Hydrogenedentota bacterium]
MGANAVSWRVLVARTPSWARRLLVFEGASEGLAAALSARAGGEVSTFECEDDLEEQAWPEGHFDCIVLDQFTEYVADPGEDLALLARALAPTGRMLLRVPNRAYYAGDGTAGTTPEEVRQWLGRAGMGLYRKWSTLDPASAGIRPGADGKAVVDGKAVELASPADRECAFAVEYVFAVVRTDYNPVQHAHRLFDARHPEWAYEVLTSIPEPYLADPEVAAVIYSDCQFVRGVLPAETPSAVLRRFFESQVHFYRVVSNVPAFRDAYYTQAELWRRLGDRVMALRLLRSLQHAAPDEKTARLIAANHMPEPLDADCATIEWSLGAETPRVLMLVTPGKPHYGMDVLYDGLCTVLGVDHVTEFPWKPTLHGAPASNQGNYPCLFDHPGEPVDAEALLAQLGDGCFDFVLFCDLDREIDAALARRIVAAAADVPLFIVDVQDDPVDNRADVEVYLQRADIKAYFKREMLACRDYGPTVFPFPFAYPDRLVADDITGPRTEPLFWAGHRLYGLRRLYLEYLEKRMNRRLDKVYPPEQYLKALRKTCIGLSLFGFGYDTVRYWELPAQGCMLLAERLPLCVPHNFRDAESAVFFDDLKELEEKLAYYLEHAVEAAQIAAAGHTHLKQFHTGSARARQLLGWVDEVLHSM